jgi:hypothetical protein
MGKWKTTVSIKKYFTEKEDYDSLQESMNNIADDIESNPYFDEFDLSDFRNLPKGDDIFGPVNYANKLLERLYDYADYYQIWIE